MHTFPDYFPPRYSHSLLSVPDTRLEFYPDVAIEGKMHFAEEATSVTMDKYLTLPIV